MIKNKEYKDISGVFIILLILVFGLIGNYLFPTLTTEKGIGNAIANIIYILPIALIIILIKRNRQKTDIKATLLSVLIFFILSIFFPINVGYGILPVFISFIFVLIIYLMLKLKSKIYNKPILNTAVISIIIFTISLIGNILLDNEYIF